MQYAVAIQIATWLVHRLRPSTERCEIAGSIRRGKADVGDIEIVCIPKLENVVATDIWGNEQNKEVNRFDEELDKMIKEGVFAKPKTLPRYGERYKKLIAYPDTKREIQVDIFEVLPPGQWGVLFTIHTGSADFSHSLVTYAREIGMRVKEGQLLKIRGANKDGFDVIPCPEEENFFKGLGIPFIEPLQREGWYDPKIHASSLKQEIAQ